MKLSMCSYLLAFVLGWNVAAGIINETVAEKTSVRLCCPQSVDGRVTWSRQTDGGRVDVLTVNGDGDIRHIHDPYKRFSSQSDKSLLIQRVTISDSGTYFCDNRPAVQLTVSLSGPTGPRVPSSAFVPLGCSSAGGNQTPPTATTATTTTATTTTATTTTATTTTATTTTATTTTATTTTATTTTPPPTTTTTPPPTTTTTTTTTTKTTTQTTTKKRRKNKKKTTTPSSPPAPSAPTGSSEGPALKPGLLAGIAAPCFLLLLLLLLFIICCIRRSRSKSRGAEETNNVYDEIQDGSVLQPTNGVTNLHRGPAAYCMTDFTDASKQNDPTYCTIPDPEPVENMTNSFLPDESPYSLISHPAHGEDNKGLAQLTDNTYFLLQKPNVARNLSRPNNM